MSLRRCAFIPAMLFAVLASPLMALDVATNETPEVIIQAKLDREANSSPEVEKAAFAERERSLREAGARRIAELRSMSIEEIRNDRSKQSPESRTNTTAPRATARRTPGILGHTSTGRRIRILFAVILTSALGFLYMRERAGKV